MKKILSAIIIVLAVSFTKVNGQNYYNYNNGIGIRGGFTYGLTWKHFIENDRAIEGIFGFGFKSLRITGLYEIHTNAFNVDRLHWFYGIGGHFGYYTFPGNENWRWDGYSWTPVKYGSIDRNAIGVGIDGILGLEYQVTEIPFAFSLDIKPAFEYNTLGYFPFIFWDGAFSIRYVF